MGNATIPAHYGQGLGNGGRGNCTKREACLEVLSRLNVASRNKSRPTSRKRRRKSRGCRGAGAGLSIMCGGDHLLEVSDDGWIYLEAVLSLADVEVLAGFRKL